MPDTLRTWSRNLGRDALFWPVLIVCGMGVILVSLPPLANLSYDISYLNRPQTTITNVVLVYTDPPLDSNRISLNRTNHARVLDFLTRENAGLIFYDIFFKPADPDSPVDQTLEAAIRKNGSVILVGDDTSRIEGRGRFDNPNPPDPFFLQAATNWGHSILFYDDAVRRISESYRGIPYAGWLAAAQACPGQLTGQNPDLRRWLNYYGPNNSLAIPHYYAKNLLSLSNATARDAFAGKFVFVGQDLSSDERPFETPYTRFHMEPMPGVEIHATAFLNLIRNDWLRLASIPCQWIGAILWGLCCVLAFYRLSNQPRFILVFAALLGAFLLCFSSWYIQWHAHWWWSWIGPAIGQTTTALILVWRMPRRDFYIAFISHRTQRDGDLALLIRHRLKEHGLRTFVDVESLEAERFDEQFFRRIEEATFFLIILSPSSLARCSDEHDWVRRELAHALQTRKKIIPILKEGFAFDQKQDIPSLPEIAELKERPGLHYSNKDLDGFINRLLQLLKKG